MPNFLYISISQFDPKHDKDDIRHLLEKEFRHLAPFEVSIDKNYRIIYIKQIKIVRNPEDDQRMAYVNFEKSDCAKSVRRALLPRLQKVLGRHIALDPAGVIRDQEGILDNPYFTGRVHHIRQNHNSSQRRQICSGPLQSCCFGFNRNSISAAYK